MDTRGGTACNSRRSNRPRSPSGPSGPGRTPTPGNTAAGLGAGEEHHRPIGVHTGDCWVPADNRQPLTRDQARQAIAQGAAGCPACHAHTTLGLPEQNE
ncbi:DUF6233 domain-containing protein [Streptomyces albipurpureus]|uniref:DUF6233 domain-containing protein n=1 Tax=Streptomyces albipurpureus TaxID=2897419 RepID=UPI003CE517B3